MLTFNSAGLTTPATVTLTGDTTLTIVTPVASGIEVVSKIGGKSGQLLLFCYQYDPNTGRYGLAIMRAVRIGGLITLTAVVSFIYFSIRRERKRNSLKLTNPLS